MCTIVWHRSHGWRYIGFNPDGELCIAIGAPCNICRSSLPYTTLGCYKNNNPNDFEVWAYGSRNSVGFDWHPFTKEWWWTDNGGDRLGNDRPDDEVRPTICPKNSTKIFLFPATWIGCS